MYEIGFVIAFVIAIYKIYCTVHEPFSMTASNMKHVGLYYGPWSGLYDRTEPASWLSYLLRIIGALVGCIFSWLAVCIFVIAVIVQLGRSIGKPQIIKEIRWKIQNLPMSKEEVEALLARITA